MEIACLSNQVISLLILFIWEHLVLFSDFNLKVCCMGLLHCSDLNAVERFSQNYLPVLVGFILAGTIFLV